MSLHVWLKMKLNNDFYSNKLVHSKTIIITKSRNFASFFVEFFFAVAAITIVDTSLFLHTHNYLSLGFKLFLLFSLPNWIILNSYVNAFVTSQLVMAVDVFEWCLYCTDYYYWKKKRNNDNCKYHQCWMN